MHEDGRKACPMMTVPLHSTLPGTPPPPRKTSSLPESLIPNAACVVQERTAPEAPHTPPTPHTGTYTESPVTRSHAHALLFCRTDLVSCRRGLVLVQQRTAQCGAMDSDDDDAYVPRRPALAVSVRRACVRPPPVGWWRAWHLQWHTMPQCRRAHMCRLTTALFPPPGGLHHRGLCAQNLPSIAIDEDDDDDSSSSGGDGAPSRETPPHLVFSNIAWSSLPATTQAEGEQQVGAGNARAPSRALLLASKCSPPEVCTPTWHFALCDTCTLRCAPVCCCAGGGEEPGGRHQPGPARPETRWHRCASTHGYEPWLLCEGPNG